MIPINFRNILSTARLVCFDFDSTIIKYECLDRLARLCHNYDQVKKITDKGMSGEIDFNTSLTLRMDMMKPKKKYIQTYERICSMDDFNPNVIRYINYLQNRKKDIFVISGGFEELIFKHTDMLNIPKENVICNKMFFDKDGKFTGFDNERPTAHSFGKRTVIENLKEKYDIENKRKDNHVHGLTENDGGVIMIGDGETDLQTKDVCDLFVGYGGVTVRQNVKDKAEVFITDFNDLF
jgi:phosphoserine phosphatase